MAILSDEVEEFTVRQAYATAGSLTLVNREEERVRQSYGGFVDNLPEEIVL